MYDCHVLWTGKYYQSWENETHAHSYYQIIAGMKGEGTIEIGAKSYPVGERRIFLIPPQLPHAIRRQEGSQPPQLMDIKFNVNDEPLRKDLAGLDTCLESVDFNRFQKTFGHILQESEERKPYYYQRICYHFGLLLTNILRDTMGQSSKGEETDMVAQPGGGRGSVGMDRLIQYMNQNYAENISLAGLAEMANISKTTLIQVFKSTYGTTPIKYIISVRLEKAKELLTNTEATVGEISELIGFQSIHYFSRYFKSREGVSPNEYRLRHSKSHFYTYRLPADGKEE